MKLFKRNKALAALRGRVEDQMVALWNRNQLIADQDHEIDRLRKELRSVQTSNADLIAQSTELREEMQTLRKAIAQQGVAYAETQAQLEAVAVERDYWQGRAANP